MFYNNKTRREVTDKDTDMKAYANNDRTVRQNKISELFENYKQNEMSVIVLTPASSKPDVGALVRPNGEPIPRKYVKKFSPRALIGSAHAKPANYMIIEDAHLLSDEEIKNLELFLQTHTYICAILVSAETYPNGEKCKILEHLDSYQVLNNPEKVKNPAPASKTQSDLPPELQLILENTRWAIEQEIDQKSYLTADQKETLKKFPTQSLYQIYDDTKLLTIRKKINQDMPVSPENFVTAMKQWELDYNLIMEKYPSELANGLSKSSPVFNMAYDLLLQHDYLLLVWTTDSTNTKEERQRFSSIRYEKTKRLNQIFEECIANTIGV